MQFKDREEAAKALSKELVQYKGEEGVVLAVPRGGVPIGRIIADELNFPLDLILIKKLGYPMNPEFAIGSVSLQGYIVDERYDVPEDYIESESRKIQEMLKERHRKYLGGKPSVSLAGKTVIIVDDGIATGNTILAAVQMVKKNKPSKVIVATPVAPAHTAERLSDLADEFIVLYAPEVFYAVGQFYENFDQVSDEEVMNLLQAHKV